MTLLDLGHITQHWINSIISRSNAASQHNAHGMDLNSMMSHGVSTGHIYATVEGESLGKKVDGLPPVPLQLERLRHACSVMHAFYGYEEICYKGTTSHLTEMIDPGTRQRHQLLPVDARLEQVINQQNKEKRKLWKQGCK